jgi:hypothetical protein
VRFVARSILFLGFELLDKRSELRRDGRASYWSRKDFPIAERILALYSSYYNQTHTHLALGKDAPLRRAVQGSGTIIATPILFGLHHRYARI